MNSGTGGQAKKARPLVGLLVFLFWIAVWTGASLLVHQELLIPSPLAVLRHLWNILRRPDFFGILGKSLLRVLGGYVSGCLAGVIIAVLCGFFRIPDVQEMMRNKLLFCGRRFGCADIHPPVNLHAVHAEDIPSHLCGQFHGEIGFAARGRSGQDPAYDSIRHDSSPFRFSSGSV